MTNRTEKSPTTTIRGYGLDTAKALTEGDRNADYGDPLRNMSDFAAMITTYLRTQGILPNDAPDLRPLDGSRIMEMAKWCRHPIDLPFKEDTYIDAIAYSAMSYECARRMRDHTGEDSYD